MAIVVIVFVLGSGRRRRYRHRHRRRISRLLVLPWPTGASVQSINAGLSFEHALENLDSARTSAVVVRHQEPQSKPSQ